MCKNHEEEQEITTNLPVPQSFWGAGLYGMTIRVPYYRKERDTWSSHVYYYFPLTQKWYLKGPFNKILKSYKLSFVEWECIWVLGMSTNEIGTVEWARRKADICYYYKPENTKTLIMADLLGDPQKDESDVYISKSDLITDYYNSRKGNEFIIDYDFSEVPTYLKSPREYFKLSYDVKKGVVVGSGTYKACYYRFILEGKDVKAMFGNKVNSKRNLGKEEFIRKAIEVHGPGKYDYSEVEYVNNRTRVKITCLTCGRTFYQSPDCHLSGRGCPKCVTSRGENFVSRWLDKNNIEYLEGKRVDGVSGRNADYVFPDFQITFNNIKYWIEYNGPQHYEVREKYNIFTHSISDFEKQLLRDKSVRDYCKSNNIVLIEIPYTFNNYKRVEEFLNKVLIGGVDPYTFVDYFSLFKIENTSLNLEDLFPS